MPGTLEPSAMWLILPGAGLVAWAATRLATGPVLRLLERRAILDHPIARSSHAAATPRGGGLALVPILIAVWGAGALVLPGAAPEVAAILALTALLAALSWLDDLRGLAIAVRLVAQVAAVALGLWALPAEGLVFQGLLPPLLDALAAGLLWLWFLNLFNFMDGIDGLAGVETVAIGMGLCLAALVAGWRLDAALYGLAAAAAALGFLHWNWPPARLFLGDVGSVPLGFALGWLLLWAAVEGLWATALILPLYYLADATLTLCRRLLRGERVWLPHRDHFYQVAARGLGSHLAVLWAVLFADLGLVGLAVGAAAVPAGDGAWLIAASLLVAALLWYLQRAGGREGHGG